MEMNELGAWHITLIKGSVFKALTQIFDLQKYLLNWNAIYN
ncbi:MAG: hypothetical protein QXE05_12715 [Nitrososphaeria archaeon]